MRSLETIHKGNQMIKDNKLKGSIGSDFVKDAHINIGGKPEMLLHDDSIVTVIPGEKMKLSPCEDDNNCYTLQLEDEDYFALHDYIALRESGEVFMLKLFEALNDAAVKRQTATATATTTDDNSVSDNTK